MRCTVVTGSRSPQIGDGLTYDAGNFAFTPGDLVMVPLRGKMLEGVVVEVFEKTASTPSFAVKPVSAHLGNVLPPAQAKLSKWMADEYRCSIRSVLTFLLPSPPWSALQPRRVTVYRVVDNKDGAPRGKKQIAVLDFLRNHPHAESSALREATGASTTTLKSMEEAGWIVSEERVETVVKEERHLTVDNSTLPESVRKRAAAIVTEKRPTVCWMDLAERRELYIALVAEALVRGRQSIVLFPEVFPAEDATDAFRKLFGDGAVALIHSRMTPAQRRTQWRRIQDGTVRVVVGTRTALFAPCRELGLVIVDDEQERTYKSDETPRYLTRPVAEALATFSSSTFVIGAAVPGVDIFAKIEAKQYAVEKKTKTEAGVSPAVRVIDLKDTAFGNAYPFSPPLLQAIAERLQKREQSLLLFNRRGAGTAVICEDCRRRVVSRDGNVPLTVHYGANRLPFLVDHATGAHAPLPDVCPTCKSPRLKIIGAGTQSIEQTLKTLFPTASILRADSDSGGPEETEDMLRLLRDKQTDILVGTRSILKSIELPSVTLAAVLLADTGLSVPDFRAGERVFQTVAQLVHSFAGRPGNSVIIQTYRPDAPEIALPSAGEDERYLKDELMLRAALKYPPATRMIKLIFKGEDARGRAESVATSVRSSTKEVFVSVGPSFHDSRIWQVLLRGGDPHPVLRAIDLRGAVVDVDPLETA